MENNFELKLCSDCTQMTNHFRGVCQKCRPIDTTKSQTKTFSENDCHLMRRALIFSSQLSAKEIEEIAIKFIDNDVMLFNGIGRLGYLERKHFQLLDVLIKHGIEIGEGDYVNKLDKLLIKLKKKK